jgi:hypothetical protein
VNQSTPVEAASALLGTLDQLVPAGSLESDLALEMGLSAWMRMTGTALDDAPAQLLRIRRAVLEAAHVESATEPIPFVGRSTRLDVLHLATYLADLVDRAVSAAQCDRSALIQGALACLALDPVAPSVGWNDARQLRTS